MSRHPGISACILARNEEKRIDAALQSLLGWTDQIIVIDHASTDGTRTIARKYTDCILSAPPTPDFDGLRNLAIDAATGDWIFYLDADERVPAALRAELRRLISDDSGDFVAVEVPFRHYFCGQWMQSRGWWPGYTRPQLLKKGHFRYGERLHAGVEIQGRVLRLPPDPNLAVTHLAYDDISHFLEKTNFFTDIEAHIYKESTTTEAGYSWQAQLGGFVQDWQLSYDQLQNSRDGIQGFELAFLSAFHRFVTLAKSRELRRVGGEPCGDEAVPADVPTILRYMLSCAEANLQQPLRAGRPAETASGAPIASPLPPASRPAAHPVPPARIEPVGFQAHLGRPLRVRWEGDFFIHSSLARVNREFCLGLLASGDVELSLRELETPWKRLSPRDDARLSHLLSCRDRTLSGPPDVVVRHHFPPNWERPEAGKLIVIQPWEYSHLPAAWARGARDGVDELWAYSRWVRDVYVRSGVPAERVHVVPLGVRADHFQPSGRRFPLPEARRTRLLFVGGALHRKGIDLLLDAYRAAFQADDDVSLIVKDFGAATFYQAEGLRGGLEQALADRQGPPVIYLDHDLSEARLAALYRACHCVVLPYRGEGFALAPLEGMACGLPAIVTAGGATDDYCDDAAALRLPFRRRRLEADHPAASEHPAWILEPDRDALVKALRWVHEHPEAAAQRGKAARQAVVEQWTWEHAVSRCRERLAAVAAPARATANVSSVATPRRTAKATASKPQPELSVCLIARDEAPRIADCLRSVAPIADELIVVDTGSLDRTREIARAYGAQVFNVPWMDSFAAARNASLDRATGKWVFWLDADDVLPPECGPGLRRLIAGCPQRDTAYQVQVRIPAGPDEFGSSLVDHVKLFPNRADLRFEFRIHEQILPAIRRAGLQVAFSNLYVSHQNYDRSDEGQARKRARDFRLLELDLADHPDHPFVLFNLGMTHLHAAGDYELAEHYLRRSLYHSDPGDSIVRKTYALLTTSLIRRELWRAALTINEQGRAHYPEDAELLFQAGQLYQQLGDWDAARTMLDRLVEGSEGVHYRSTDAGLRTYRGRHELALLHERIGNPATGARLLKEIGEAHPDYLPAQVDRVRLLCGLGDVSTARSLLEKIPPLAAVRDDLQLLRRQLGLPA